MLHWSRAVWTHLSVAAILAAVAVVPAQGTSPDDMTFLLTTAGDHVDRLLATPDGRVMAALRYGRWHSVSDGTPHGTDPIAVTYPDGTHVVPDWNWAPINTWWVGDRLYARQPGSVPVGNYTFAYTAALCRISLNGAAEEIFSFTPKTGGVSMPSYPMNPPRVINGSMFFYGQIGSHDGPCISDGTTAGTRGLTTPGPEYSYGAARSFVPVGDKVVFAGNGAPLSAVDEAIYAVNASRTSYATLATFGNYASVEPMITTGDLAFLTVNGRLYVSNGSSQGTKPAGNVTISRNETTGRGFLGLIGGLLIFEASSGGGPQLWRSNGTDAGTFPFRDAAECRRTTWSLDDVHAADYGGDIFQDKLLFRMWGSGGLELWATDGTDAGTTLVAGALDGGVRDAAVVDGRLYIATSTGLYRSLGTPGSEVAVPIPHAAPNPAPMRLTGAAGRLFFIAEHATLGFQFYATHYVADEPDSDGDGTLDFLDAWPHDPRYATDTDRDGLPDEWEMAWFGDLSTADQYSDTNGDGMSDLLAFTFDLNPHAFHELGSIQAPFFQ